MPAKKATNKKVKKKTDVIVEEVDEVPAVFKKHNYVTRSRKFDADKMHRGLEIIAGGGTLQSAGEELGVPYRTLATWFYNHAPDEYMKAREIRAIIHVDEMREYMRDMIDGRMQPEIFREIKDLNKWQAAHENSKLFSEKRQLDVNVQTVTDYLDGLPEPDDT